MVPAKARELIFVLSAVVTVVVEVMCACASFHSHQPLSGVTSFHLSGLVSRSASFLLELPPKPSSSCLMSLSARPIPIFPLLMQGFVAPVPTHYRRAPSLACSSARGVRACLPCSSFVHELLPLLEQEQAAPSSTAGNLLTPSLVHRYVWCAGGALAPRTVGGGLRMTVSPTDTEWQAAIDPASGAQVMSAPALPCPFGPRFKKW